VITIRGVVYILYMWINVIRVRLLFVSSDIVSLRATLLDLQMHILTLLFVLILMEAQQRRRAVANEAMVCT